MLDHVNRQHSFNDQYRNEALLDPANQKLKSVIDTRLAGLEPLLTKEISALEKRTEQLDLPDRDSDDCDEEAKRCRRSVDVETGGGCVEKSIRDHASLRQHDDEERHAVVF